jgi:conjugal transfer pilus assembly protein TraE
MIFGNIILSVKLLNQEIITRNIPLVDNELIIGSDFVNDAALKIRADQIIYLIFSMKKENAGNVTNILMRHVDASKHQDFKKQISKLAEDIKARGYRYFLSDITGYEFDNLKYSVKVSGYLDTYMSDKKIATNYKEYQITFINRSGVLNLASFEEVSQIKKEETNNNQEISSLED